MVKVTPYSVPADSVAKIMYVELDDNKNSTREVRSETGESVRIQWSSSCVRPALVQRALSERRRVDSAVTTFKKGLQHPVDLAQALRKCVTPWGDV